MKLEEVDLRREVPKVGDVIATHPCPSCDAERAHVEQWDPLLAIGRSLATLRCAGCGSYTMPDPVIDGHIAYRVEAETTFVRDLK